MPLWHCCILPMIRLGSSSCLSIWRRCCPRVPSRAHPPVAHGTIRVLGIGLCRAGRGAIQHERRTTGERNWFFEACAGA